MYRDVERSAPKSDISSIFFSVVIPAYNRAHLITRALNSLIAQTESDWEAIVIDDGSTDDTYSGVKPFLHMGKRIKYRKIVHSGESSARNEGILLSNGRYITFLDSDDEYKPEHLKSRRTILTQHPSINFLHGGASILGNQYVPDRFDPDKLIHLSECVIGGTFFIEQQLLRSLGGFKQILLGPDADLFERALKAGADIMKTMLPTYIYHRESLDSITNIFKSNDKVPDSSI
ncbi:MAG: glycosyltransferase family A protein [Lentimicrobiaceae bacterium]|jgi:glycosyltransferase involved in cell wall biosynthesis|nr:glycosyltransferase family A protein [Lentimicrobiaceae bacterium]MDD4596534.1 glycosyltransferase family A protein [Lentimicrobiaceae bacterium]MDY0026775.1 glycosyltransferase family A protein [Lentimicrobium sp.]